jgi:hypothetical protein
MKRLSFPVLALVFISCMACGNQNNSDKFTNQDTAMTDGMDSAGQTADRTRALPPDTSHYNIGRDSAISSPDTSRNRQ